MDSIFFKESTSLTGSSGDSYFEEDNLISIANNSPQNVPRDGDKLLRNEADCLLDLQEGDVTNPVSLHWLRRSSSSVSVPSSRGDDDSYAQQCAKLKSKSMAVRIIPERNAELSRNPSFPILLANMNNVRKSQGE